ncbi:MAG: multidrug ABC transporter substrate-binding protein [Terriglobia bacterium]|nr:MAG: multidrug ABC transporter substrate-binding protein [Terriglobia bacterium]
MSLRRFFRREQWDRERSEEIESYVRIETDENVARGLPYAEARAAALRKLGNRTVIREEIYRMNTVTFLDTLVGDIRYGLRMFARSPTFTAAALLTLAIGIGANTAVFSVVNSVLVRPLRYPKAEELVALHQDAPGAAGLANAADGLALSPSMYFTYAEQNRTFQALGVWLAGTANVTGLAEPEQVRTVSVSDGVLQALGVPPTAGRWLLAADQIPQAPEPMSFTRRSSTVMLSYGYWQRHFGGDRSAIGRSLTVDSLPRQIVGIMPKGFRIVKTEPDLILPLAFDRSRVILAGFAFNGIGRLKPGVTIVQANADLARLLPVWMDTWTNGPGTGGGRWYENWKIRPTIRPLKQQVVGNVGDVLWVVMGTIALVMLIACANVTNLLLVRAEARQHELALRAALGARVARIVRSLLVESVMLGLMGGALGVGVAYAGLRLLVAIGPADLPRLNEISVDARTFAFTLILSVFSGLLLGLVPALRYAGPRISAALQSAGRTLSVSRERHRARNLLVVAQVAIALVLLVSAGLMIRTAQALRTIEPGFTGAEHLQTVRIAIPSSLIPEPQRVIRTQNDLADRLAVIPGVTSVGFAREAPMEMEPPNWDNVFPEGKVYAGNVAPLRRFENISPGFLHTTGARLVAGRELTWTDVYGLRPMVLISENLAREFWGTPAAAIGKRLRQYPSMPWQEVIGVVQDVRQNGIQEKAPEIVYWPAMMPNYFVRNAAPVVTRAVTFVIRSERAGTEGFVTQVRQAVWAVNASLPLASVRTMREIYEESLATTSFTLVMMGIAGAMALMLGLIGIYGVISYAVSQRTREIGIRVALGAEPGALRRLFVRYGLALAGAGTAMGLVAAAGLTRLMKSVLFGISPVDPLTYTAVPLILVAATVLASYLPARRAAAVDPVKTLRAE